MEAEGGELDLSGIDEDEIDRVSFDLTMVMTPSFALKENSVTVNFQILFVVRISIIVLL